MRYFGFFILEISAKFSTRAANFSIFLMALKLVVTTNVEGDVFELVLNNSRYGVGRRHDNDLRIKETYISGYHAELVRDDEGRYLLADLGSSNGTFLNGRRLAGKEAIKAGDVLKFGILKVEVKEHAAGGPKIVALADHPAFARAEAGTPVAVATRNGSSTSAVATAAGVAAAVATRKAPEPAKTGAGHEALEKMWQARLDAERKVSAGHLELVRERDDKLKELRRELAGMRESLTNTRKEAESVRKAAELSAEEVKTVAGKLEQQAADSEKAAAELAARETELRQIRKALEAEQARVDAAWREKEGIEKSAKVQADREAADAKKLTGELAANREEVRQLRQQLESAAAELDVAKRQRTEREKAEAELAAQRERESRKTNEALVAIRGETEALRKQLEESVSAAKGAAGENERLSAALAGKDAEIVEITAKLAETSARVRSLQSISEELAQAKSSLATESSTREEVLRELADRESELAAGRLRIESLEAELRRLGQDADETRDGLSRELTDSRKRIDESTAEIARLTGERDEANRQLELNRSEISKKEALTRKEQTALADRVSELEQSLEAARAEAEAKSTTLARLEERSGGLESRIAELLPLEGKLAGAELALKEALSQAGDLDGEKSVALKRIATLEEQLRAEGEARRALAAAIDEKSAELDAAKAAAAAEKNEQKAALEKVRKEAGAEAKAVAKAHQTELARLEKRITETERELEESRRLSAEAGERSAVLAKECEEWRERSGESVGALDCLRAELAEALAARDALAGEKDALAVETTKQVGELQTAKAEANGLRMELNRLREESEKSIDELNGKLRSRVAELDTNLARERIRADEASQKLAAAETQLGERETELKSTRSEADQLRARSEESARTLGRIQAELNREIAERTRLAATLKERVEQTNRQLAEIDQLKLALESKEREIVEREQQLQHNEAEAVQKLKAALAEQESLQLAAEEKAARTLREKQTLSGSFERLRAQLEQTEEELRRTREAGEELKHAKGLIARRLEKEEASNIELAARIKEEAIAAIAHRELIEKLEQQIRENESEAVQREREQVLALQADLSRASRRAAEDERRHREFQVEIARLDGLRQQAEARILALETNLVERESETLQTRELLTATEGQRVELSTRLAAELSTIESHARTIETLRHELAETHARFTSTEAALIARHHEEKESLLVELRAERLQREGLAIELDNTREGLSEALRHAREDSVKRQAALLAQGNEKLAGIEDELTAVIRDREEVERQRNALEDELNQREEEIEALAERIEDLEIRLREEDEARQGVLRHLDTTREGFSEMLRSNWDHLSETRLRLSDETEDRIEAETELDRTRAEIARLNEALDESQRERRTLAREWEDRYETLRQEKLTLASEDADLREIREQIQQATGEKRAIEDQMVSLAVALRESQGREAEFRAQREALVAEREQLKAGLNAARLELSLMQKRTTDYRDQAAKQEETIAAAERRIQSLRKLEAEIENAVERKRQHQLLSRGDVFSDSVELPKADGGNVPDEEFFRKLIAKLDLIDDLAKRYDNKWLYPRVAEQLGVLKRGFVDFLQDHSVRQFDLQPGTVLSLTERKRIKLVSNGATRKENGSTDHPSCVVETIRPGYIFQKGTKDVIIRKAEVVVS